MQSIESPADECNAAMDARQDDPPEESPILDALERFAEFVDELFDNKRPIMQQWEGNVDQTAIRSLGRVLSKWRHAGRTDRPPHSLIVRLAEQLPPLLVPVCEQPKRWLKRRRSMQSLSRVRELDSSCIRWVIRQPGVSLAEKAGHRRSILAVERFESLNTLENRVVFSLLRQCRALAKGYLRQHQPRFSQHRRVRATDSFLRLCNRLLRLPMFTDLSSSHTVPKPNYVLLHDDLYHKVWRAYLQVVRQQRRRRMLWTYRKQAYADMAAVALLHAVRECTPSRAARKAADRHEFALRHTPLKGSFIDWRQAPPVWQVRDGVHVFAGPTCFADAITSGDNSVPKNVELFVFVRTLERIRIHSLAFHLPAAVMAPSPSEIDLPSVRIDFGMMNDDDARLWHRGPMTCPVSLIDAPHAFRTHIANWCGE